MPTRHKANPENDPCQQYLDSKASSAPRFVGRPPTDAGFGLVRLETGELRHYNYGHQGTEDGAFYLRSRDDGETWSRHLLPPGHLGADWRSPQSGDYLRLTGRDGRLAVIRHQGGIDGPCTVTAFDVPAPSFGAARTPIVLRRGGRILAGACTSDSIRVLRSDDDGHTWLATREITIPKLDPYRPTRWNHGPCEPAMVELEDGRIWMLMRTGRDHFYESFSMDAGDSWSPPVPSRFYSQRTMPTLGRLRDGRLLLLWCNTTPMPELEHCESTRVLMGNSRWHGRSTDVFTNRDAAHAAISEDDGRTWIGFRELWLDPRRNAADYALTGGVDRGVHQIQFVELDDGRILAALGQHPLHRAMLVFGLDWLYESGRHADFTAGDLADWSVQSYVVGVEGHRAINRRPGAQLIPHPDDPQTQVLHIACPASPDLWHESQGATWNFPAASSGRLSLRLLLPGGSQGLRISLLDRWINPTDPTIETCAMFSLTATVNSFPADKWHDLRLEWRGVARHESDQCAVFLNGTQTATLPLLRPSSNGISYLHLQALASQPDDHGGLVSVVDAERIILKL